MSAVVQKNPVKRLIVQLIVGAIVGGASVGLFLTYVGRVFADLDDMSTVIAMAAGVSYVVIGLGVAFGLVAPRAGATYLNVEDADELREQKGMLAASAIACVLTGAFLLILTFADAIGRDLALPFAGASLVGIAVTGWMVARRQDELTKQVGLEASTLTLQIVMVLYGCWAALVVLGYASWITPLAFVASLTLLQLFAIFVVIAKRGMLMPR